jgi:hypothetical protein
MRKSTFILLPLIFFVLNAFTQNVGIGVTNPAAKLEIRHTSGLTNPHLLLYDNQSTNYSRLQFQNSSGAKYWTIAGYLHNTIDANSRLNFYHSVFGDVLILTGDGKAGIGGVPTERLDVNGNINLTGALKFNNSTGIPGQVLVSNGSSSNTWQNLPAGASVWSVSGNNIYNNNAGRVGIGTTAAPSGQLEVKMNSGAQPQILLNEDENDYSRLTYQNTNGTSFTTAGYTAAGTGTDNYNVYSHKTGTDLMQVSTDPKATVAINGSMKLKKVSINLNIPGSSPYNDLQIGDASVIELGWTNFVSMGIGATGGVITGIAGGVEGRIIYIFKKYQHIDGVWGNHYAFKQEDTRSLPENRLAINNIDIDEYDGITLIYVNGRWRCFARYD